MWLDYFSDLTKFWTRLISWSLPTQVYLRINDVENGKVISAAIKLFVDYVWWRWLTVKQVWNSELKSGLLDKEWKLIHTRKHASDENLLGTMILSTCLPKSKTEVSLVQQYELFSICLVKFFVCVHIVVSIFVSTVLLFYPSHNRCWE